MGRGTSDKKLNKIERKCDLWLECTTWFELLFSSDKVQEGYSGKGDLTEKDQAN